MKRKPKKQKPNATALADTGFNISTFVKERDFLFNLRDQITTRISDLETKFIKETKSKHKL